MAPLNGHLIPPAPAAARLRWWRDLVRLRRAAMWVLAAGVAAFAAIVSYSHIYDLGRAHGGTGTAARLLPLSVDMLILAGELMLLHEADGKGHRFPLAWMLVWSGILATLAANVTYGFQHGGYAGAVIWGWPAYSFILVAAGMVAVVKRGGVRAAAGGDGTDTRPGKTPGKPRTQADSPRTRAVTGQDKAADMIRRRPDMANPDIAAAVKVDVRTVRRARAALNGRDKTDG